MKDQSEQSILDWLKENFNPSGLRSLLARPPKAEQQVIRNVPVEPDVTKPEAQEPLHPAAPEPHVVVVSEVPETIIQANQAPDSKVAHVVITADIPEGMTLNVTIQVNADGKATVSQRILPAPTSVIDGPLVALPNFRMPNI
ncbi:MAG TPA: hypothetical protein VJM08_02230, partial [Anaerolineales bacterium]|nr:hypothetical protein [Anaerolineales bacterium]